MILKSNLNVLVFIMMVLSLTPGLAWSACTSPAAQAGAIEYFTSTSQYKLCTGTAWEVIELSSTELGECSKAKARKVDPAQGSLKICNGSRYQKVNCVSGSGGFTYNYCFDKPEIKLKASDGVANDFFGYAAALSSSGDTAIVGAYQADSLVGAAYIFKRSGATWSQQQKIGPSDPDPINGDFFGFSVAFSDSGDTAIVGANAKDSYTGAVYVFTRSGSTWTQQQKITASDLAASDEFGYALALSGSGDTAIVGAYGKNSAAGAAYVFTRTGSTWSQQQKIIPSDPLANDYFGAALALSNSGDTALVGAEGKNTNTGAAYVFTRSGATWTQQQKITAPDAATNDRFGGFVDLSSSGETAIMAASGKNTSTGAAYIFTRSGSTWAYQQKILASDGSTSDTFGAPVALSGSATTALVGAFRKNSNAGVAYVISGFQHQIVNASDAVAGDKFGWSVDLSSSGDTAIVGAHTKNSNTGAAYIYIRTGSTWTQQQKITASDAAANDYFGQSVALSSSGDIAIVGADGKSTGTGAAYVFTRSGSTWTQQQKITASDAATGDAFGHFVALSSFGDTAIVGAQTKNTNAGAAYVFTRSGSTWTQQQKLTASDAAANDYYGKSVALSSSGDTAIVGAYQKSSMAGAAYVYTRSGSTWTEQQKLTASDTSANEYFGRTLALSSTGDTALIGAYQKNSYMGAAYVFTRSGSTWTEQQKLLASDAATGAQFGISVALSGPGDTAIIGAWAHNSNAGAAYVFARSGTNWIQQQKIIASDAAAGAQFGISVALSQLGDIAIVGNSTKNSSTGAVYSYSTKYSSSCTQSLSNQAGTAAVKSQASPWTALSNINLRTNDTLLVCVSSLGTVSGVTWNGTSMNLDASNTAGTAKVGIYSLTGAGAGTGNIVVSTSAATTTAISAATVTDLLASPLDKTASASGTSTAPSSGATSTTAQATEFIFGCIGTNGPVDDTAGTWSNSFVNDQRQGTTGAGATSNVTASSASLFTTSTGTFTAAKTGITSRAWGAAVAIYKISTPAICQTYGSCNRNGAIDYSAGNGLRICDGTNWRQIKTVP